MPLINTENVKVDMKGNDPMDEEFLTEETIERLLKDEYLDLPDWVERIHDRSDVIEQMTDWLEGRSSAFVLRADPKL